VRECARQIELDRKLPAILCGKAHPANVNEGIELAQFCHTYKRLYGTAARLWEDALTTKLELAEDLQQGHRYNAACSAALAGCGQGDDAVSFDAVTRARWRKQALDWLRADLAQWTRQLGSGTPQVRTEVQETLQHWRNDPDLAGLRDEAKLGQLPASEREQCRKLWAEVDALLARARK
jgi:hypothetical protein